MNNLLWGVIVGGLMTGAVNWGLQLQRWHHEDKQRRATEGREDRLRWLADRRAIYIDFMHATRDYEQLGRIVMLFEPRNLLRPPPGEAGAFYRERYEAWMAAVGAITGNSPDLITETPHP